jgi:thiamine transporter
MNTKLQVWIEGAIVAGVAMALSYIPIETPNAAFDLSVGLIPLAVYAARRGTIPAIAAGFVWGLLHIILGKAYILSIPQVIFEYPFAFAFAGFGGLFAKKLRHSISVKENGRVITWVVASSVVAVFARWFWHFWAGVLVWGDYAPEGMSPVLYSFIFNGASFLANAAMLIIVLSALAKTTPILFKTSDRQLRKSA